MAALKKVAITFTTSTQQMQSVATASIFYNLIHAKWLYVYEKISQIMFSDSSFFEIAWLYRVTSVMWFV